MKQCTGDDNDNNTSRVASDIPCPPGTRRNLLGICESLMAGFADPFDTGHRDGRTGCAPGTGGADDGPCRPVLAVPVVPVKDGFLLFCVAGTKPSPIDGGCVPSFDQGSSTTPADDATRNPRSCPPGMIYDWRTQSCRPSLTATIDMQERVSRTFEKLEVAGDLTPEVVEHLAERDNVLYTPDIARALAVTREALAQPWQGE